MKNKASLPIKQSLICCLSLLLLSCSDKDRICTTYYDSGEVRSTVPCPDGIRNGTMSIFHKSGTLWNTKEYVEGKVQDTMRFYYSRTGDVLRAVPMKDNEKHGRAVEYDKKGNLVKVIHYLVGLRDGALETYYEDGELKELTEYKEGNRHGKYQLKLADGTLVKEGTYIQDRQYGKWRSFRPDGTQLSSFSYYEGIRHGGFGVFRTNGMPYLTGNYYQGKINGPIKYFNKGGEITYEMEYNLRGIYKDNKLEEATIPFLPSNRFQIIINLDTVLIR
ncbi:MAG: hypothetical protein AAFN10_23575 [Bacteroidota bacterium]